MVEYSPGRSKRKYFSRLARSQNSERHARFKKIERGEGGPIYAKDRRERAQRKLRARRKEEKYGKL